MNDDRRLTCLACGAPLAQPEQLGDAAAEGAGAPPPESPAHDGAPSGGPDADTPAPRSVLPEDAATRIAPAGVAREFQPPRQPPYPLVSPRPAKRSPLKRQLILAGVFLAVAIVAIMAAVVVNHQHQPQPTPEPGQQNTGGPNPSSPPQSTPGASVTTTPPNEPDISVEMEAFLHKVEPLINLSGKGMDELAQATAPSDPGPGAPDAIQYVIDNRTEVREQLSSLSVPDDYEARACRSAFKKAMTCALDADYLYLDWANGDGDKDAANPENAVALNWKRKFLNSYNSLAARYDMRHDWEEADF